MSKIRAPLSIEQLKEIQARNTSPDVLALLWEVCGACVKLQRRLTSWIAAWGRLAVEWG
ncbi:hypothetical protein [Janthinobacterium sp. MDT1-19]|uniref:hypothetical protein n=1 Tax=Janthinobacterium sp. MDT1-19 TaxID=1259339 RepID=UPI003F214B65